MISEEETENLIQNNDKKNRHFKWYVLLLKMVETYDINESMCKVIVSIYLYFKLDLYLYVYV